MPHAAPKACLDCGVSTTAGPRCPDHAEAHRVSVNERRRKSSTQRGYGYDWQKRRARHLALEPLCRMCKAEKRLTVATDVDHIVPRSMCGSEDDSNLQSLCHSHHSTKTDTEDGGFGRKPKVVRKVKR